MKKMSKLLLAFLMILSMFGINDVNALDNESLLDKFPNTIEVLKDFLEIVESIKFLVMTQKI